MPTAVITGATKGLGRAIADIFAQNGFDLCVCSRTQADLDAMQEDWGSRFPQRTLHTDAADLGKKPEVQEFADFVLDRFDRIDVLVNNAGLYIPGLVSEEPSGTLETLMEVNFYSAYYLTRALLPRMVRQGKGHIFNMCSIAGIQAYPNGGSYTISKFALRGFSMALRAEMKTRGIKVTTILPGATWSDSWRGVDLPEDRLMQAEDVARSLWAAYNLSDSAVVEEIVLRPLLGDL